jgi:hypothetical protein
MSSQSIAYGTVSSFEAYVVTTSTEEIRENLLRTPSCLADFIEAWVQAGYGVRACQGNFETLLIVVMAIIDHWRNDPDILSYVTDKVAGGKSKVIQRRVESIFGECGFGHNLLDRDFLAEQTFRELYGDRPLSP